MCLYYRRAYHIYPLSFPFQAHIPVVSSHLLTVLSGSYAAATVVVHAAYSCSYKTRNAETYNMGQCYRGTEMERRPGPLLPCSPGSENLPRITLSAAAVPLRAWGRRWHIVCFACISSAAVATLPQLSPARLSLLRTPLGLAFFPFSIPHWATPLNRSRNVSVKLSTISLSTILCNRCECAIGTL